MISSFRVIFMARSVECHIVVKAKNFEDAKQRLFDLVEDNDLNGLYYKSLDQSELKEAEAYIKNKKVNRDDIKRMQKVDNDEWI
jgi:hypothetical protein